MKLIEFETTANIPVWINAENVSMVAQHGVSHEDLSMVYTPGGNVVVKGSVGTVVAKLRGENCSLPARVL